MSSLHHMILHQVVANDHDRSRPVCGEFFPLALLLGILIAAINQGTAFAGTNGTWIDATTGGLWSTPGNWLGNIIADGQDATADFSTLNITADNTVHLNSARTIGQLIFGDTTPSNNWILDNNGSVLNVLTLNTTTGTPPSITVNNQTATISTIISGTEGFTKLGTGTLVLSGAETYTGDTNVSRGTLVFSGSTPSNSGTLSVGNVASQNAIVQVNSGANLTFNNLLAGSTAAGNGAVYQTGGTVTLTQGYNVNDFALGNVTNGYGYYKLSGGTLISNEVDVSGSNGTNNVGVMDVTNGVFNDAGWITIQRSASAGTGVLNVNGGIVYTGTALNNGAASGGRILMLSGGGSAQLNIANGSIIGPTATGYTLDLASNIVSGSTTGLSVANLNSGGVLQIYGVTAANAGPTALLNFNGGTLRFAGSVTFNGNANNTTFLSSNNIDGVFIYSGGATIDNNSGAITILKQLQAPVGSGLASTLATTGLTTTGYVGAPAVTISGGSGVGATAVAVIDPTTGALTGINVTNPGSGYSNSDTVTVTLNGGGVASSSRTVSVGEFVTNANTGGLNITGGGITIIGTTATDTYTGNTSITGGLTRLDFNQSTPAANIISSSSRLVMNGGILNITGKASTANSQTFNGTTLNGGGGLITMSPGATGGTAVLNLGTITRNSPAALNITLSGTSSATNGVTTNTTNTNGIIGGWATVGGASNAGDWATNSTNAAGGNIIAYSGYNTSFPAAGPGDATVNYSTTVSATTTTTLSSSVVANSLKLAGTAANNLALGSNNLTFSGSSGGLLFTGNTASSITGTGVIGGGSGNEFIIQDWGTGSLSISAPIIGTSAGETGKLVIAGLSPSSGTPANVNISSSNTYTGGTTLIGGTLTVSNNNALGTGPVEMNPNGVVAPNGAGNNNQVSLSLGSGIVIPNAITLDRATALGGAAATINATGAAGGEIDGNITINGGANPGGHFNGPTTAGVYLTLKGKITQNVPLDNSGVGQLGSFSPAYAIIVRNGNMKMFNPANVSPTDNNPNPSSYFRIDERAGTMQLGNNNGIATNSSVDLAGNGASVLDLNGFNQTLTGISDITTITNQATVTNTSTTSAATLTLAPAPITGINANLQFGGTNNATTITDVNSSFPLNLVINGDPTGVQRFNPTGTAPVSNSYHGSTTLTSGTLSVTILANGNANSAIGASSNAAANLVFDGGTLQYTGATVSTDRNFTITAAKVANINVSTAATTLTMSGVSPATTGGLAKFGSGTLLLTGAHAYTGPTTVNAGTLQLNGSLAAGSVVTVANTATLSGTGTANGLGILNRGGTLSPGDPSVNTGVGTFSIGGLTLTSGSLLKFDFGSGNDAVNVNNSAGLILNGGGLSLLQAGTSTAFTSNGTYPLFTNLSGGLGGGSLSNLIVTNAQLGKSYSFAFNNANPLLATAINLTIQDSAAGKWTNNASPIDESWTNPANWVNSAIPNGVSNIATFGSDLANGDATVKLNGSKTLGGIIFDNGTAFNIIAGSGGNLIMDNGNGGATPAAFAVNSGPSSGSHTIAVPITLNSDLNVQSADSTSLNISGAITGAGKSLNVSTTGTGTGVVILSSGSNAYGSTNVTSGTLQVGNTGGLPGSLGAGNATISAGATLSFGSDTALTLTNNLTGASGTVAQNGTGTTTLSPTVGNTFGTTAGGILVNAGTLKVGNANALPSGVIATVNGGTLNLNGISVTLGSLANTTTNGIITDSSLTAGTTSLTINQNGNTSFGGAINDGATPNRFMALNKAGAGILTLTGVNNVANVTVSGGTLSLANTSSTNNTIAGNITVGDTVGSDILQLGASDQLSDTSVVTLHSGGNNNSAFFQLNSFSETVGGIQTDIAGSAAVIENGAVTDSTLTVNTTGSNSYTYDGILRDRGTGKLLLTKNGNGTLTLMNTGAIAATNYTGDTNINGGTLVLNGLTGFASAITINSGVLALDGTWTLATGINGSGDVLKQGTGTVTLTNNGSGYGGKTTIANGTLAVTSVGDVGSASSIGGAGAGGDPNPAYLVFGSTAGSTSGALQYTGTGNGNSNRWFTISDGTTATIDVANASSTLTMSGSSGQTTPSTGSFQKAGAGTLVLSGNHAFTGSTTVSGGTLLVNGAITNATSINLSAGATLGGTNGSIAGTFNHTAGTITPVSNGSPPTTLTFTGPVTLNGGTVLFNIDASSLSNSGTNVQSFIAAQGGLTFGGTKDTIDLEFSNVGSIVNNTTYRYKAFTYGSLAGSQSFNFVSNVGRSTITIAPGSPAGEIDLNILAKTAQNLTWVSTSSSTWDVSINQSNLGTQNWSNNAGTVSNDTFFNGDNVTFDGGVAGVQTSVNVSVNVAPATLTVTSGSSASPKTFTFTGSGKITGPTGITTTQGSGAQSVTLILANTTANDYVGDTNIGSGTTLQIGDAVHNAGVSTAGSIGTTGVVNNSGTLAFNRSDATTISNVIHGSGNVSVLGPGNVTLSGSNDYNGNTTISGGTVSISAANNIGNGNGNLVFSGGQLSVTANNPTISNPVVVNSTGGTINGALQLNGALSGNGTLILTGTAAVLNGDATNGGVGLGFQGTIQSNGQVNLGAPGGSTNVTSANAAYVVNVAGTNGMIVQVGSATPGAVLNLGSLSGIAGSEIRGANTVTFGSVTLSIGNLGTDTSFGSIADNAQATAGPNSIGVTKVGGGKLTLTGQCAYSGATIINGGTLELAQTQPALGQLNNGTGFATSGVTINSGGTLLVSGVNAMIGFNNGTTTETVNAGGVMTLAAGITSHVGAITLNGGTLSSGATSDPTFGGWAFNGTPTVTVTDNSIINAVNMSGATNFNISTNKTLTLSGNYNGGTGTAASPIALTGPGTLNITAQSTKMGNLTVGNGTVILGVNNAISGATASNLSLGNSSGGGTLSTSGNSNTFGSLTLASVSATNTINMGAGNSTLNFSASNAATWDAGSTLLINGWNYGHDHLNFASATGLTSGASGQLSQIQFADFHKGASIADGTTSFPIGEVTPMVGDINQDGTLSAADVSILMYALSGAQIPGTGQTYQAHYFSGAADPAGDVAFILDANEDGHLTGADIQAEIARVANFIAGGGGGSGGGQLTAVPEPGSFVLLAFGGLILAGRRLRRAAKGV